MDFHYRVNFTSVTHVYFTGFTEIIYKISSERLALKAKVESGSAFTFNSSLSYNLLYFNHARKARQVHVSNRQTIYATVEILLKALNATIPLTKFS